MTKADNMLSVLWLLKSRKRITAAQLADELEIHIRSVYRYIDALCASGVPIVSDSGHNGGYSLLGAFAEAPLLFDADEQKALMHAAVFAQEAGYPFGDALERAVSKLKKYSSPDQLDALLRHAAGFDVIYPPSGDFLGGILQELELSVAEGRTLRMDYQKGYRSSLQSRSLDPYGIVFWKSKWYVVGFCHKRHEIRSFRADRIRSLTRTGDAFRCPEGFSARAFFMNSLLPDPAEPEQLVNVRMEGKPQAISDLCDHWLFGHTLVERTEEQAAFRMEEGAVLSYVPHYLLAYGRSIRVLEPAILQERLAALALELHRFHLSPLPPAHH